MRRSRSLVFDLFFSDPCSTRRGTNSWSGTLSSGDPLPPPKPGMYMAPSSAPEGSKRKMLVLSAVWPDSFTSSHRDSMSARLL